jgi:hypothetical protein
MKHIPCDSNPQLGWTTEGLESSRECTGEGVEAKALSWSFDGVHVNKWGDGSSSAFGVEWQEGDVLGLVCDMVARLCPSRSTAPSSRPSESLSSRCRLHCTSFSTF